MNHNVVARNYNLSVWYPATSPICGLDNYRLESMAHLLHGCKEFEDNYSKRHDNTVGKVAEESKHSWLFDLQIKQLAQF